jgi:hypothetical protein
MSIKAAILSNKHRKPIEKPSSESSEQNEQAICTLDTGKLLITGRDWKERVDKGNENILQKVQETDDREP